MPDNVTPMNQSATLMVVTLLAYGLRPGFSMCETRCEQSIPSLYKLRAYWFKSFKRVGEHRVSFEQFLLSLVQQSDSDDEVTRQLRSYVLRVIGRYQDCVMACEHQFSKRSQGGSGRRGRSLRALSADVSVSVASTRKRKRVIFPQIHYTPNPKDMSCSRGRNHGMKGNFGTQ